MNTSLLINIILIFAGLYISIGAAANWDWFMSRPKTERMIALLGWTGTRILYIVSGAILIGLGLFNQLGLINIK